MPAVALTHSSSGNITLFVGVHTELYHIVTKAEADHLRGVLSKASEQTLSLAHANCAMGRIIITSTFVNGILCPVRSCINVHRLTSRTYVE